MRQRTRHRVRPARWAVVALLLFLVPGGLVAQRGRGPVPGERLGRFLDLTEEQQKVVQEAFEEAPAPGRLWNVAVALRPTLSDAQKAKLTALGETRAIYGRRGAGYGGPRGWRRETDGTSDRPGLKAIDEARSEALGLTGEQVERLEDWRADRERRRPVGGLPPEVAETLTDEQREIAEIHDGLAAAVGRAGFGRGNDRPGWRGRRFDRPWRGR